MELSRSASLLEIELFDPEQYVLLPFWLFLVPSGLCNIVADDYRLSVTFWFVLALLRQLNMDSSGSPWPFCFVAARSMRQGRRNAHAVNVPPSSARIRIPVPLARPANGFTCQGCAAVTLKASYFPSPSCSSSPPSPPVPSPACSPDGKRIGEDNDGQRHIRCPMQRGQMGELERDFDPRALQYCHPPVLLPSACATN